MTSDQPVILRSDDSSKPKVKSPRPLSIIKESATDELDPANDGDWLLSATEEILSGSSNGSNINRSTNIVAENSTKGTETTNVDNVYVETTIATSTLKTHYNTSLNDKDSKTDENENLSKDPVSIFDADIPNKAVECVPETYGQTNSYRSTRRKAVAPLEHPVVALGHHSSSTSSKTSFSYDNHPQDIISISNNSYSFGSNLGCEVQNFVVPESSEHVNGDLKGGVDYELYDNRKTTRSLGNFTDDHPSSNNVSDFQGDFDEIGHFCDIFQEDNEAVSDSGYSDQEKNISRAYPITSHRANLSSTLIDDRSAEASVVANSAYTALGSNNLQIQSCFVNQRDLRSNYVNSEDSKGSLSPEISRGRSRELKSEHQIPPKRKVLDTEQLVWRDKVKRSHSLSMPEKFRPIVRSTSAFDAKHSSQNLGLEVVGFEKSHENGNGETLCTGEKPQFFLNESSAGEKEKFTAKNTDNPENLYSVTALSQVESPRYSKFESLRRKLSWQETYKSQRSRENSLSPIVQRKFSYTDNIPIKNLSQSYARTQSRSPILSPRRVVHKSNIGANVNSTPNSQSSPVQPRRISAIDQSDFTVLKATTNRLNLPTRRQSTLAWREKYLDNNASFLRQMSHDTDSSDTDVSSPRLTDKHHLRSHTLTDSKEAPLSVEHKTKIDEKLSWLREELINIRLQDQSLARQFLEIRNKMNNLRLAVKCKEHEELIEDAEEDMEDLREFSRLVDIPPELLSPLPSLQHIGITRMNITARRFSTC